MARYIDVEKIAEHKFVGVTYERYVSDGRPKSEEEIYAYKVGYNEAIESIAQFAPTADVVEVVRCKDCRYSTTIKDEKGFNFRVCCQYWFHGMIVNDNDYCSQGMGDSEDGTH